MSDWKAMTPQHPEWGTFLHRLTDLLDAVGDCDGTHRHTRALLDAMEMDVAASLAYYQAHGGGCDCEVVMNVDRQELMPPASGRWN